MSAFTEFFLSCSGVVMLVAGASALLIYLGRRKQVQRSDRELITEIRHLSVPEQIARLQNGTVRTRACAAAALADTRDSRVVDALIAALADPEAQVVSIVLKGLAGRGDPRTIDAFLDKLAKDDSIAFRPSLLPRRFTHRQDDLVEWLIGRDKKGDPDVIPVIGSYTIPKAAEHLIGLLRNNEISLWDRRRKQAAEGLAYIYLSGKLGRLHTRLIEGLEDPIWFDHRTLKSPSANSESAQIPAPTQMRMTDFIGLARAAEARVR
jgi:hypothetical protein